MELDPARQQQAARRGGGVCISEDYGVTWQRLGRGLPEGAATSVVLDPKSDPSRRTLYVAMFGHGLFQSTDSGATWTNRSNGLGKGGNLHVYSVKLHVDGTLMCSVTGKRTGTEFASWECISPPLKWAGGFDFDPHNSNTIYLTASTAPRHSQGGLYKTSNGGASWQQLIKEGELPRELHPFIHAFYVTLHPHDANLVYFSAMTHGLFVSRDAGATWREVEGIPFTGILNVTVDPLDDSLWVTTEGGGVWKGPSPFSPGLAPKTAR
jgi:photosystem II stability/assembly factor-like uncharacterized protein